MAQPSNPPNDWNELHESPPSHGRDSFHGPGRQYSWLNRTEYRSIVPGGIDSDEEDFGASDQTQGLGLRHIASPPHTPTRIQRVPVGSRSNPTSPDLLSAASPPLPRTFSQEATPVNVDEGGQWNGTPQNQFASGKHSSPKYAAVPGSESSFHKQAYSNTSQIHHCPTHGDIVQNKWSWYSVSILILAVYSTIFSAVFLGIALKQPRWGDSIGTRGRVSFGTATLLSALFSKTVELSFATVFVALLGQKLSRRAFAYNSGSGGISLAEMNMRSWIMQPGTLLTHWEALKYTFFSRLGAAALIAAVMATFYTTAAEALVAPKLKLGPWQSKTLGGRVTAMYANVTYLGEECKTPIPLKEEPNPQDRSATCLQISYAGRGLHDFQSFISNWTDRAKIENLPTKSTEFTGRPSPLAMLYDNTTVVGQWLESGNITKDSIEAGRLVLNVSMVLPHANLFHAAREPSNHILQPEDLQGQGEYFIRASVPSPSLNILCAGVSANEVDLYFNNLTRAAGNASWPDISPELDKIFQFTLNNEQPPLFDKAPLPYNTIANDSKGFGNPAIYMIGASPENIETNPFVICSLKTQQYPNCTNKYHVTQSGGELSVHCDNDVQNVIPYLNSVNANGTAPFGNWDKNWKEIGREWIRSVALNVGSLDGKAVSARLITQMIPPFNAATNESYLNSDRPTIAEALGSLGAATLLISSADSPFIHYWNYTDSDVVRRDRPLQYFPAQVKYRDYTSGLSQEWQGIFYVVLSLTFAMNVYATVNLIYHFLKDGQVTDYTEPQNMFALALMSQPSPMLSGSCGAGPHGAALGAKWAVGVEDTDETHGGNPHFYVQYRNPNTESSNAGNILRDQPSLMQRMKMMSSSVTKPGLFSWDRLKWDWQDVKADRIVRRNTGRSSLGSRRGNAKPPNGSEADTVRLRASGFKSPVMQHYLRLSGVPEDHWT